MNGYTLRKAERDDIPSVLKAEVLSFSDPWTEGMLLSSLESGIEFTLLTDNDGATVGYSVLDLRAEGEAELHKIAILPSHRGKGLSRLLMDKMITDAKNKRADGIFLEVRSKNAPAVGLYEKYGFIRLGVRRAYYKSPPDDALIMKLTLCTAAENTK